MVITGLQLAKVNASASDLSLASLIIGFFKSPQPRLAGGRHATYSKHKAHCPASSDTDWL